MLRAIARAARSGLPWLALLSISASSAYGGLGPPGGALAQADAGQPAPLVAPVSPTRQFQTRFDVVDAPERFDQVLQIIDFPAGTWTPLHTPGSYVYTTVIDGAISTRLPWLWGVYDTTYQAGETFVERPGEYMQVGNATSGNTRIMATALLRPHSPLTIYQDGFTSNAYPTLTDWNYTHDIVVPEPGPATAYRSAIEVDRPGGAFELVQLVLELAATQPPRIVPDWAQIAALYGLPAEASPLGDEVLESCATAWGRVSSHTLDVEPYDFERVAANLCVSSTYVPFHVAASAAYGAHPGM
jgi:hypothetical protein